MTAGGSIPPLPSAPFSLYAIGAGRTCRHPEGSEFRFLVSAYLFGKAVMTIHEPGDVLLVEELLFSPCGLVLEKIPEQAGISKTPDFQILSWRGLSAYCELKSPTGDDWLDRELANAQPGQIVGGARHDPTFNRIGRHIRNAAEQFDAVNPSRQFPNVLVFVNHDHMSVPSDLFETITGRFPASDGSRDLTMPHTANWVSKHTARIDLCIWIDARKRAVENPLFIKALPDHAAALKELFRAVREAA